MGQNILTILALLCGVLGIIGFVSTLVLLAVQLAKKKTLKAVKIVPLVSVLVFALGVGLLLATGQIQIHTGPNSGQTEREIADFSVKVNDVISFTAADKDGNAVDSSIFKDSKVTLVNCWEPWCSPCKDEMPDLQALYEKYEANGFNIIGVYMDEGGLEEALELTGVSYPIIHASDELKIFGNNRPTTVFVDSEGRVLEVPAKFLPKNKCALVGARTSEDWEALIVYYLEQSK